MTRGDSKIHLRVSGVRAMLAQPVCKFNAHAYGMEPRFLIAASGVSVSPAPVPYIKYK